MNIIEAYEFMGLGQPSDKKTVTVSYRRLARVLHPDVGGSSSNFQLLNEAYNMIIDHLDNFPRPSGRLAFVHDNHPFRFKSTYV